MSTSLITRQLHCLRCSRGDSTRHFTARFWTRRSVTIGGVEKSCTPSYNDLRCPDCGAPPQWFEGWPKPCGVFTQLRSDLRPVVYRWHDEKGNEHYRYPSTTTGAQRPNEERVEFPTLRSMTTFLKEQNPNHRDWNQPLNDILDYDEAHIDIPALDTSDPGVADEADEVLSVDDFGTTTQDEVDAFMKRTDGTALIESK